MNSRRQSSMSQNSAKLSMNEVDRGKKTNCEICGEKFNVLHREHVCKRCLRSICSGCGKQKKKVMGYEVKPEKEHRICTPCKKESDKLDDMKRDYGMVFGKDSKIVPTWLNTMGIQNWPDVEDKFGEMVTKAAKMTNLPPFKVLQLSLNVQSYNSNFFSNYSFVEMMCLTQAEVPQKVHQTIKDTLSVFLYKYHDTVGFSDDLLNLAVFLLCFSSPAKVFCLLEAIYSGKIIPTHLFPIRDDEFQINGNPQKKQVNDQILKILKEKFKCEGGILNKMQKFLEELGSNCIESLLIAKLNFDCCFSLFDALMTCNGSKYTQLVKEVATVLFVNREIICGKPPEVGFDLWKEILNRTQKEEVFLQMKWELKELIIPVFEDKTKALESLNKQLSETETELKTVANERESLKKELAKSKSDNESAEKQAREAERMSNDQISKLHARVSELEDLLVKQREESELVSDRSKSQMETSIAALQIKNKQLEESRDQSKVKANGLEIDLQQLKLKFESDKKQHADEEAIQKQKNMSYEKIVAQLHDDINAAKVTREQLEGQLRAAEEKLSGSEKTIEALTVLKEKDQKVQENLDQLKASNKDFEQKLSECEAKLKANLESLENEKKTSASLQSKHAEELSESERKSAALEELLSHKSITSTQLLKDKESAFALELKQKSDMFAQSLKEITKLKQETTQLSTENHILKEYKKENEGMKEQEHNKSMEVCKALNDTISSKNALIAHLEEQLVQIKQTVADVTSAKDQIEKEKQAKSQEMEDVSRQLREGQAENQDQKASLDKSCQEIEALNRKVEDISRQLTECQQELEKQQKNEELNKQLEANRDYQSKLEGEIAKLAEELKQCHSKIEEGLKIKEQLTAELDKKQSQVEALSSQDGIKQAALESSQKELETVKEQLKGLTEEGKEKDIRITEMVSKLKECAEDKQKLLGQLAGFEHEKTNLVQQLGEGKSKVELLEETNSRSDTQLKSYSSEITELREQLSREEQGLAERDSQLVQLRDEYAAHQETVEKTSSELKKQLVDCQNSLQEMTHKCDEQHKQIEKLHRQIEFEEQSISQLQAQLSTNSGNSADSNEAQVKLQVDLQELQKKHFELEGKLTEANEEVALAVAERNSMNEGLKKAQDELKQLQDDVAAAKKVIAQREKEIVVKQTELRQIQNEQLDAHHNAVKNQESQGKEVSELKKQLVGKKETIAQLEQEKVRLEEELGKVIQELTRLQTKIVDIQSTAKDSTQQIELVEKQNKEYQDTIERIRAENDKSIAGYSFEISRLKNQAVELTESLQNAQKGHTLETEKSHQKLQEQLTRIADLENRNESLKGRVEQSLEENQKLTNELINLRKKEENALNDQLKLQEELLSAKSELKHVSDLSSQAKKSEDDDKSRKILLLTSQLEKSNMSIQLLSNQIQESEFDLNELRDQLKQNVNVSAKLRECQEKVDLKTEENLILQSMIRQLNTQTPSEKEMQSLNQDLKNKCKELESEIARLKSEVTSMEKKITELLSQNELLNSQLTRIASTHHLQLITLSEENTELMTQQRHLATKLATVSESFKTAMMKLFLLQLEFHRVHEISAQQQVANDEL